MAPMRSLGQVIRQRRLELGWSQEELAERISAEGEYVRQSEVSRLERGRVGLPRRARLERIAAALELPLGELLARSGWAGAGPVFDDAARPSPIPGESGGDRVQAHAPIPRLLPAGAEGASRLRDAIDRAQVTRARSAEVLADVAKTWGLDPGQPKSNDGRDGASGH